MAQKLKHLLDARLVRALATDLRRAHRPFRPQPFIQSCLAQLDDLELTQRARHIADAMHRHLPRPFPAAAAVLVDSLGPELAGTDDFGAAALQYMPHVFFIEKYGLDHFEAAMQAQYELTKRFSAEWSIRAYLLRYPQQTYVRLLDWTQDRNAHVRRLVSEGTRPRLPWAPRLRAFQKDPAPVIALLDLLKDDAERYVQRSVANNLNDIGKDHPKLVVEVCRRWLRTGAQSRKWIVNHALRSLVKGADASALAALGVGAKPRVRIRNVRLSPVRIEMGGTLQFSFEIESTSRSPQNLLVDYAVYFADAHGAARRKVFKLRRLTLAAGAVAQLADSVSFRRMTTRRHYPGRHSMDVVVNGIVHELAHFELLQTRSAEHE